MAFISTANPWAFVGNIGSFGVYLSQLPAFIRIIRKKSTEGFQSFSYIVAVFSTMLWIYYAWSKINNASLLITMNSIGCVIEVVYISIFVTYAPKKPRATTVKLVGFINFGVFGAILVLTQFLTKGESRIRALGWICVALSASVFGAPLSIIKQVIRTKSVEPISFWLFFTLLLSAFSGLFYGIFLKDTYIAASNILGIAFSMAQMILYAVYRKNKGPAPKTIDDDDIKLPETIYDDILKPAAAAVVVVAVAAAKPQTVVQVAGNCGDEKVIPDGPDRAVQVTQCPV